MKKLVTVAIVGLALAAAAATTTVAAARDVEDPKVLRAEAEARLDARLHAMLVDLNARRARGE